MSTVQETKAAATENGEKAFEALLNEIAKTIGDENITTNVLDGAAKDDVNTAVEASIEANATIHSLLNQQAIKVDENTFVPVTGAVTLTIEAASAGEDAVNANVVDGKWKVKLKVSGTVDGQPTAVSKDNVDVPVDVYTAEKIQEAAGFDSMDIPVQNLTETDMDQWNEADLREYIQNTYLKPQLNATLSSLGLTGMVNKGITLDVDGIINDEQTQWIGTVSVENALAYAVQQKAPEAATVTVGLTSSESNVTAQLNSVIAYLKEQNIKIPFGYGVESGVDVPDGVIADIINPEIQQAEEALEIIGANGNRDMTVNGLKVTADGTALEGVLTKGNSRVAFTLPVNIVSIESLEVITNPTKTDYQVNANGNAADGAFAPAGMTVRATLSTGSTVTVNAGKLTGKATADNAAKNNGDVKANLLNGDCLTISDGTLVQQIAIRKLGPSSVTLTAKGTNKATTDVAVNVVSHSKVKAADYPTNFVPVKAESDASDVATARIDNNNNTVITGRKAGKAILTLTSGRGETIRINVEVKENGVIIAKIADVMDPVYITLYDTTNGFEVDRNIAPYVVGEAADLFTAEYVTYNGNVALKITPKKIGGNITATDLVKDANVIVYGADKKLAAGYQVAVTDKGVQKRFVKNNIDSIKLDKKAVDSITRTLFYKGAAAVTMDVTGTVNFRETDKMIITPNDASQFEEEWKVKSGTVELPASEVSSLTLTAGKNAVTGKVTAEYLGKSVGSAIEVNVFQSYSISKSELLKNLYLSTGKITVSAPAYISAEFNDKGELVVKPLKTATNKKVTITLNDDYIAGEIYVILNNNKVTLNTGKGDGGYKIVSNALEDYQNGVYTPPSKTEYYIGEDLDISDAKYEYVKDGKLESLTLTADMFAGFDSSVVTEENHPLIVTMTYGGIQTGADKEIKVTIKAKSQTVTASDIALIGADITDVIYKGDNGITAKLSDGDIVLTATKTSQSGTLKVTASDGRTVDISVSVDAKGNFSVGSIPFEMHSITVTKEELSLTPYEAEVTDETIVKASVADDKVILESMASGSTTVTVSDHDGHKATITVTVAKDGSMTYTVSPYVAEAWEKGEDDDWYYIKDGKRVVSAWVSVTEADPYNNNEVGEVWYHFGADGKMQRGWIVDETGWKIYLLDSNGRMMHSQWVNAPAQESLNRPAGIYHLTADGAVQMNGWAQSAGDENIYWFCNAGNGLFEQSNPASWASEKLW